MAEYRRFVAYVYEYVKGVKDENRGFIKVEVKNGMCRMQFQLRGKGGFLSLPCKIYGFVRENTTCKMLELGECNLSGNKVEFSLEFSETQLAGSTYTLSELAGIIFWEESGIRYATQWDDEPLQIDAFVVEQEEEMESEPEIVADVSLDAEVQMEEAAEPMEAEENYTSWDYQPFFDGEVAFCKKITPQDISLHNNFLLYGYEQYQHLLLGKLQEGEKYILGVPGIYAPQEKFMAGVFGFPYFKAARKEEIVQAALSQPDEMVFGYWYRLIKPSDLNI